MNSKKQKISVRVHTVGMDELMGTPIYRTSRRERLEARASKKASFFNWRNTFNELRVG